MKIKLKQDKHRKKRGGKAFMIHLVCSCGHKVLYYQKDGDGTLKRCYLNRIFAPEDLERLQHIATSPKDVDVLSCQKCEQTLGMPIMHHSGRIAFRLRRGMYTTKKDKK